MNRRSLWSLLLASLLPTVTVAQAVVVDPTWLRQWQEGEKVRPAQLTSVARIAAPNEPGVPMVIHGSIVDPAGAPASGVVILAYHRDAEGLEFGPRDARTPTWRLQGWARTDGNGKFTFTTIRPAPDHLGREGAHIHFTLVSQDHGRQWAPKVFFADDELVSERQRRRSLQAGEFGWVRTPRADDDGVQHLTVRLRLSPTGDF